MRAEDIIRYGLGSFCIVLIVICLGKMVYQYVQYRRQLRSGEEYNPAKKKGWVTTTGRFTGRINSHPSVITKLGLKEQPYKEYEVEYYVDGKTYQKWYKFYPTPEPEDVEGDISIVVAYCEKKPWMFDIVEINW
ncbi:MAG: hypothetical protein K2N24_07480 [Lachnospiraceae bacterium]|nr:hypothetical protein [Lachnospiraceae bacterium]